MADAYLRALERRATQEGPEEQARVLRERLRRGTLTQERLELAAALGYPGAARALDLEPEAEEHDLREWLWGFLRWGPGGVARALVVACRYALQGAPDHPDLGRLEDVLCTVEEWCDRPDLDPVALEEATERAGDVQFDAMTKEGDALWCVGTAVMDVAMAAWIARTEEPLKPFLYKAADALGALGEVFSEEQLRAAIREGLLEWALGGIYN